MIKYKKIDIQYKDDLLQLIETVLNGLERKEFFMPFTDEDIEEMFDDNKTIVFGAFDNDKLVGTAQLYLQQDCVEDIKNEINLNNDKVGELGGYLVLKEYRNKGIMKELASILIKEAKRIKYEYLIITVHPDNIPSNKVTESIGAKIVKTAYLEEYLRNIYLLKL